MPNGGTDTASQGSLDATLHLTRIDIRLSNVSSETISSVKLSKNKELLRTVKEDIRAGSSHPEHFSSPISLQPDDHILASVDFCSKFGLKLFKRTKTLIDIDLRNLDYMRVEDGKRLYWRKQKDVEVEITTHQNQLDAVTTRITQVCSRFRLLIIGNSGVGKSSLINSVFGVEDVNVSKAARGAADIDQEFVSQTNERFVVHDSLGFEAGDEENMEIVKEFVARRKVQPRIEDQLHAIWLCLEIPYAGGRLLEAGVKKFLQRRGEILGDTPLVVVLTKVDLIDRQLEIDLEGNDTFESSKKRYMDEHCIEPLRQAAGSNVTHVSVSVAEDYPHTLRGLLEATNNNMKKYLANEAPQALIAIAQRISIKDKIDLCVAIGKKKYWKMLLKSTLFRGHTLKECLQVIHKDIITVWNFTDPTNCLNDDTKLEALFRTENLGETTGNSSPTVSFGALLLSALELSKGVSGSGVSNAAVTNLKRQVYQGDKKDVKVLMAYTIDLICVMQAIFLLASGGRVTPKIADLALQTYESLRGTVHQCVNECDVEGGLLPGGGNDQVLEEIERLIWRYSIPDNEIRDLKKKMGKVVPEGSGSSSN